MFDEQYDIFDTFYIRTPFSFDGEAGVVCARSIVDPR
jgi:hypothetical protein